MPITDEELNATARITAQGDPQRFRATMAAPPQARRILFPIYAANVEIARAPWVSQEALIAQMRLQWWADALEEIGAGDRVRRHEVATPLAKVLPRDMAARFGALTVAREWDIEARAGFADADALCAHIGATNGNLTAIAATALGAGDAPALQDFALAAGLASWLEAVPSLIDHARSPLPDPSPAGVAALARAGLAALSRARACRRALPAAALPALLPGWHCGAVLRRAAAAPERVTAGTLAPNPAVSAAMLAYRAASGRW